MNYHQIASLQRAMRSIPLRQWRERTGLTQKEVAQELNVDPSTVARWEDKPDSLSASQIKSYLTAIGHLDIATPALEVDDPYSTVEAIQELLLERAQAIPGGINGEANFSPEIPDGSSVRKRIRWGFARPRLGIVGPRNSGKTTFVNSSVGGAVAPAAHQPLTRVPTLMRHIRRRPESLAAYTCAAFIGETADEALFEVRYTPCATGGLELLDEYAIHHASGSAETRADLVVCFYDAPILLACDLIDLPGIDESDADTAFSHKMLEPSVYGPRIDGLFFCSHSEVFCRQSERVLFSLWRNTANTRRDNIWFVATRAPDLEPAKARAITDALKRLPWGLDGSQGSKSPRKMEDLYWKGSDEALREKWFPFYQPTPREIDRSGIDEFKTFTEAQRRMRTILTRDLAAPRVTEFYRTLGQVYRPTRKSLLSGISATRMNIENAATAEATLAAVTARAPIVANAVTNSQKYLATKFDAEQQLACSTISTLLDQYENHEVILKLVRNNYSTAEKKEGIENAPAMVSTAMQNDIGLVIRTHLEKIRAHMSATLMSAVTPLDGKISKSELGGFTDNVTAAAIEGGAGVFLFVAGHAVAVPAVAGLAGAAATYTGVAALAALGPLAAIAVTLAAVGLVVSGIVKWFRGWQENLARSIAKRMRETDARSNILSATKAVFKAEKEAWERAISAVESDHKKKLESAQRMVDDKSYAITLLTRATEYLEKFDAVGWPLEVKFGEA